MSETDDQTVIDAVNRATGAGLTRTGRAAQGTLGGAIFVELRDGTEAVITRYLGPLEEARRTAELVDHARRHGLPVARHMYVLPVGSEVVVVQERLPGSPPTEITVRLMDAVIEVNERFAGLLADRPEVPLLPLCLTGSGDPYPRHEVLAEHSDRSRRVLAAIQEIGRRFPGDLAGDDLVHVDLSVPNLLLDPAGTITGVVDWNLGAYRGDRHLALIKTRFELEWGLRGGETPHPEQAAAAARLDEFLADRLSNQDLQRYWAHRILYQLHWALPFAPPDVVAWQLEVAEERLLQR